MRFQDLLAPKGQIYYETHFVPPLLMQGTVREVRIFDAATLAALAR